MQRILTITGMVVLFVIGAVFLAGGAGGGVVAYQVPSDPVLATVLLVSLVLVVGLTVAVGFGLARGFGLLSKELTTKHDPEDRPAVEKRAVAAADKLGAGAESALKRFGYGENQSATPYVPAYSYKAQAEQAETRQFLIGFGIVMVVLIGYAIFSQGAKWLAALQRADPLLLGIGIGSVVVTLGAIGAMGFGLSLWFQRTVEEQQKAAQLKEPAWPAAQLVALEHKIKTVPATITEMTFLDQSLIALNVGLLVIFLGAIAVWVLPGMIAVSQIDQALNPQPTAVPVVSVAITLPAGLQAELDKLPAGEAAAGKQLIDNQIAPCAACHNFNKPDPLIGPALQKIGAEGATRKSGYSARAYIYESIILPSAFVPPSFQDGLMPANFKEILTAQQIADVVAYLETLK